MSFIRGLLVGIIIILIPYLLFLAYKMFREDPSLSSNIILPRNEAGYCNFDTRDTIVSTNDGQPVKSDTLVDCKNCPNYVTKLGGNCYTMEGYDTVKNCESDNKNCIANMCVASNYSTTCPK
jgi:hypothetical protein